MSQPDPSRVEAPFTPIAGSPGAGLWLTSSSLSVAVSPSHATPPVSTEDEARWDAMRRANPKLHDGPILSVIAIDPHKQEIRCVRDSYKRLSLHLEAPDAPWLLGVKGWLTARSASGEEHILIARRGPNTRMYPNLWECAPAGGIDPSSPAISSLLFDDIARTLKHEAAEELGFNASKLEFQTISLYRDPVARSYDLFLAATLPDIIDPRRTPLCHQASSGWEYTDAAWLSRADAPAFIARSAQAVSPPTLAMLRALSWC